MPDTGEIECGFSEPMQWSTPTKQAGNGNAQVRGVGKAANNTKAGTTLTGMVKLWPTPSATDNRDRGNLAMPAIKRRIAKGKQLNLSMVVSDKCGQLNPTWVEWLMGYPSGHTDCADSATLSCLKSPKK
jgi:DNA (cytosine-5)-methyltransferase 1